MCVLACQCVCVSVFMCVCVYVCVCACTSDVSVYVRLSVYVYLLLCLSVRLESEILQNTTKRMPPTEWRHRQTPVNCLHTVSGSRRTSVGWNTKKMFVVARAMHRHRHRPRGGKARRATVMFVIRLSLNGH